MLGPVIIIKCPPLFKARCIAKRADCISTRYVETIWARRGIDCSNDVEKIVDMFQVNVCFVSVPEQRNARVQLIFALTDEALHRMISSQPKLRLERL